MKYKYRVSVLGDVALVVGGLFELPQKVQLEGVDPRPVLHAHQLARLVVLERRLLGSIIVDGAHQVQGERRRGACWLQTPLKRITP